MAKLGIKARLGLVALAPTVAVAVGAGSIAADKAAFRTKVQALRRTAPLVDVEVRLHAAIDNEQAMAQILLRSSTFGVSTTPSATTARPSWWPRSVTRRTETREQLETVRRVGCDLVQGFLIGRPMPGSDLRGWLRANAPAAGLAT